MKTKFVPDHEVLNRISERLFGYREASNAEIMDRIDWLLELEKLSESATTTAAEPSVEFCDE